MAKKLKIKMSMTGGDVDNFLTGQQATQEIDGPLLDENPESRQAEGSHASESSDITKKVRPTTQFPFAPSDSTHQGFEDVTPVQRALPNDYPEIQRRRNNKARDLRTNLGRTNWTTPTTNT